MEALRTYALFLVGDADAIRGLATTPATIWIGLLLVASAAVSRNHARRDLTREWVFLLLPFAASLLAAGGLFALIQGLASLEHETPLSWSGFRPFLALFWLSAPLAWLYALPVERFAKAPGQAVAWRMKLLGFVALWRVLLTARVLSVLLDGSFWNFLAPVLLFGDGVMLLALHLVKPRGVKENVPRGTPEIMHLMGGVLTPRSREQDRASGELGCLLTGVGVLALPVLLWIVAHEGSPPGSDWPQLDPASSAGAGLWAFGVLALLGWCARLPGGQARWTRARRIDEQIASGELDAAATAYDRARPEALPYGWEPLLVSDLRAKGLGPLLDAVAQTAVLPKASRLRRAIFHQFGEVLDEPIYYYFDDPLLERLAALIPTLPEGLKFSARVCDAVERFRELDPARRRAQQEQWRRRAGASDPEELPPIPEQQMWPSESPGHEAALAILRAHSDWKPRLDSEVGEENDA